MDYYFDEKHEWNRDFFNKTKIHPGLLHEVEQTVYKWLMCSLDDFDSDLYNWVLDQTLENIDKNFSFGVFYYHWLNEYLRESSNVVWNAVHDRGKRNGMKEKLYYKEADQAKKDFLAFAKENFA